MRSCAAWVGPARGLALCYVRAVALAPGWGLHASIPSHVLCSRSEFRFLLATEKTSEVLPGVARAGGTSPGAPLTPPQYQPYHALSAANQGSTHQLRCTGMADAVKLPTTNAEVVRDPPAPGLPRLTPLKRYPQRGTPQPPVAARAPPPYAPTHLCVHTARTVDAAKQNNPGMFCCNRRS